MAVIVAHPFEICVRPLRRATLVEVRGTLDGPILVEPEIAEAVAGTGVVVMDLTRVEAFDPRGLEALERVVAVADAATVRLRLVAPRGSKLRRALDLLRFPSFVVVEDTVVGALRYGRRA